ncbi:hypothetical protein PH5382_03513 [Phaeobacter sp. CECT 5382]|uniref:hypothetical protein n=1 Tax=Phaeobacter sp. CECT 5382 TaxID=1712645 RepID=UPI0006DB86A4|nr:hypothetical protein [Phaeobacter sp. CECT 5382]CUH89566.1 hypothetical protein PH5382_03513 [Phaeobacter sp. CECT 5382]
MKIGKTVLAAVAALALSTPCAMADELLASYVAFIGRDDLYNSKGARLTEPWQILRQDRANFHRFGISQPGDEWDPIFKDVNNRATMESMIQYGSIEASAGRNIVKGGVMVQVDVYDGGARDYVRVSVTR